MGFLPFYVPARGPLKVAIVGGGYAGLTALVNLYRYRPDAEITILDPRSAHLKITHLHETFRRPLADFQLPFAVLERRFGCRHVQAEVLVDAKALCRYEMDKTITIDERWVDFDYLLITMGAASTAVEKSPRAYDLADFARTAASEIVEACLAAHSEPVLTVVGGGASGMQFLFELLHFLRSRRLHCGLRLIDGQPALLGQFPADLGRYATARVLDAGIDYLPGCRYRGQTDDTVVIERQGGNGIEELPSAATLLFVGKQSEQMLDTNAYGQVVVEGKTLEHVYAAGDCAHYRGIGANSLTAQAAVRKAKLAVRNLLRHSGLLKLQEPYLHQDLGYVISLGPHDAVGWLGLQRNVVAGAPALVVKELVEAQYDLLLAGIDTYRL